MSGVVIIMHSELRDGDVAYVQGHAFRVTGVRIDPGTRGPVVRFEGHCTDPDDDVRGTGYDGGTYGAYLDVPVTIQARS